MIQRKQTIWLLLCIICMVLSIYIPFGTHSYTAPTDTMVQTNKLFANYSIISILLVAITAVAAGFAIFLYKQRGTQKLICCLGILLSIGLTAYEFLTANQITKNFVVSFGIALPAICVVLFFMAFVGIRKDEKLLKSIDRLRD
jgi:hypothetical protein